MTSPSPKAEAGTATQGPARPVDTEIRAVRVTAADCNLALPWDKMFDGLPFWPSVPKWLEVAISKKNVWPHTRGGTDYAQWDVTVAQTIINARPGDWIVSNPDGTLTVVMGHVAERLIGSIGPGLTPHQLAARAAQRDELLALAKTGEAIIGEMAKLRRCPIRLRAHAVDLRDFLARIDAEARATGGGE